MTMELYASNLDAANRLLPEALLGLAALRMGKELAPSLASVPGVSVDFSVTGGVGYALGANTAATSVLPDTQSADLHVNGSAYAVHLEPAKGSVEDMVASAMKAAPSTGRSRRGVDLKH